MVEVGEESAAWRGGVTMMITAEWLRERRACVAEVRIFEAEWPNGVAVTPESIERARKLNLDLAWLADQGGLSDDVVELLAADAYCWVRARIARRAGLRPETVDALASDKDWWVRLVLADGPSPLTPGARERLDVDDNEFVRQYLSLRGDRP